MINDLQTSNLQLAARTPITTDNGDSPIANQLSTLSEAISHVSTTTTAVPTDGTPLKLVDTAKPLQRENLRQVLLAMTEKVGVLTTTLIPSEKSNWSRLLRQDPSLHQRTQAALSTLQNIQYFIDTDTASSSTLDIRETAKLSLAMETLARQLPSNSPLAELSERLGLLAYAAWAQLAHADAVKQLEPQFARFDRPGSFDTRQVGVGLGVRLGDDAIGGKATMKVALDWNHSLCNDDEGFVMAVQGPTISAQLKGKLGIKQASVSGGAKIERQDVTFREFNSAKVYVELNAEKLHYASRRASLDLTAKNIIGTLIRLFRPTHGSELQHYQRLQQQAADQQQRLGMLLNVIGQHDTSLPFPGQQHAVVANYEASNVKASGEVKGEFANWHANASASVQNIVVSGKFMTPFWQALSSGEALARDPIIANQRLKALEQKQQKLFDSQEDKPGTKALSRLTAHAVTDLIDLQESSPDVLQRAADNLATEFEHFCVIAQQRDAGVGKSQGIKLVEKSFANSWQGKSREDVLTTMAIAHSALLMAANERDDAAATKEQLLTLAPRLYAPPIAHDAELLAARTGFGEQLELGIRDRSCALELGFKTGALGLTAEASLTQRHRDHLNPIRTGDYIDVRLTLTGSLNDSGTLQSIEQALAKQLIPHGLADQIPAAFANIESTLKAEASAGVSALFRFYRAPYLKEIDENKYRLQLIRLLSNLDGTISMSGDVPVATGMGVGASLRLGASSSTSLYERWGDHSLSAPMMHYLHLMNVGEIDRWSKLRLQQRGALSDLFRQIASPYSAAQKEALYFLLKQEDHENSQHPELSDTSESTAQATAQTPQRYFDQNFFAAMRAFKEDTGTFENAALQFEKLMERQFPLWQAEKLQFAGREELPLEK